MKWNLVLTFTVPVCAHEANVSWSHEIQTPTLTVQNEEMSEEIT